MWRSAGRGISSAFILGFGVTLYPHLLQAQNEARYKIECTKGRSVVFEAECSSYRICEILARLCVYKFGEVAHIGSSDQLGTRELFNQYFDLPDREITEKDLELGDLQEGEALDIELASAAEEGRLIVYPNPTDGEISIKLMDSPEYEVMVVGQKTSPVALTKAKGGEEVRVSLPSPGQYIVVVLEGKKVWKSME
ncbi:MAG: T9SS type A sorting domain-containing protein [Bacteroidia bacterium]|nr:T9SS type A sorting domain-containing protein [Bacteroidia bacterium]